MYYMYVQLFNISEVAEEGDVASEFIVVDISKSGELCIRWVHGRLPMRLFLCFYLM